MYQSIPHSVYTDFVTYERVCDGDVLPKNVRRRECEDAAESEWTGVVDWLTMGGKNQRGAHVHVKNCSLFINLTSMILILGRRCAWAR